VGLCGRRISLWHCLSVLRKVTHSSPLQGRLRIMVQISPWIWEHVCSNKIFIGTPAVLTYLSWFAYILPHWIAHALTISVLLFRHKIITVDASLSDTLTDLQNIQSLNYERNQKYATIHVIPSQLYMFRATISPIIRSTWLYLQYLVVFAQVAAACCLGWVETA